MTEGAREVCEAACSGSVDGEDCTDCEGHAGRISGVPGIPVTVDSPGCAVDIHLVSAGALPIPLIIEYRFVLVKRRPWRSATDQASHLSQRVKSRATRPPAIRRSRERVARVTPDISRWKRDLRICARRVIEGNEARLLDIRVR